MNRNDFWWLLFFGGVLLVTSIWPKGGVNAAPKYGRSRNDRIPPSYKQGVAIGATVFAIEALLTFVGVVFFDMLSHRAQQTILDIGMIAACIGIVALVVVIGIHEHLEKRWERITKGKKHFTQRELREYEDLLYHRKPKKETGMKKR